MNVIKVHQKNSDLSNNNPINCFTGSKFQEAVESVVAQACKLLNAEMAGVMLYDEKKQELVLQKPAFGDENGIKISIYRIPKDGEGVGISVFRSGIPNISNNPSSDPRVLKHIYKAYPTRNLITIPLEYNSRRIGVLHVADKKTGDFTQEDLDLLSLVSNHLTLLLDNSVYCEELKESYSELEKQQQRLQRLMEIHRKLVRNILNGEGLSAIIITLADLLNCLVVVEDKHLNIVCGANKGVKLGVHQLDLKESLKSICKNSTVQQHLQAAKANKQIVTIPPISHEGIEYQRVLVPLADQYSILGYLSVIVNENNRILDEFDKIAIEQAALISSLELVKEKNVHEIETKLRGELLDDLLDGTYQDLDRILLRARNFNYDFSIPQAVAVIKTKVLEKQDFAYLTKIKNRIMFLANRFFQQSLIVEKRNNVIILVPKLKSTIDYQENLQQLCVEVEKKFPDVNVLIGVGRFVADISKIKDSFKEANRVLDILQKFDFVEKVLNYENLGIFNILYDVNDPTHLKKYVEERIGPLLTYDQNNNSYLVPTLECYLKKGSIKEAAKELFIHFRTMKYRLKKIEAILNIDFINMETCLEINMAIKISKILKSEKN